MTVFPPQTAPRLCGPSPDGAEHTPHHPRGAPSSLDPGKLTVDPTVSDDPGIEWRFRDHSAERLIWRKVLASDTEHSTRAARFESCGRDAWIQWSPSTHRYRVISTTCKLRVCPACRHRYRQATANRIAYAMQHANGATWRFVTLTLKHSNAPLQDQSRFLKTAFRRLRQQRFWSRRAQYGFAVLEYSYSSRHQQWHPHLHILVAGDYLPQKQLSEAWRRASRGSYIVDVRAVRQTDKAIRYLTSYVGKPPSIDRLPDPVTQCTEYYHALDGSRLLITFGNPPKRDPDEATTAATPQDWQPIAPLGAILERANNRDGEAIALLQLLKGSEHATVHNCFPDTS